MQLLGLTRLVFGTAGDFRLFPTMPPIVDIDGIITVEDVMQELIGEEMPTDDNGSRMASNSSQVRPPGPLESHCVSRCGLLTVFAVLCRRMMVGVQRPTA